MFELLNSWFGGVVSAISGIIVIWSFISLIAKQSHKINYDYFTSELTVNKIPKEVSLQFKVNGKTEERIYHTKLLIVNRTDRAISNDSFVSPPEICFPDKTKLLHFRTNKQSEGTLHFREKDEGALSFMMEGLVIPIGGSVFFELLTDAPFTGGVKLQHKDKVTKKRDYSDFLYCYRRTADFSLPVGMLSFSLLLLSDHVSYLKSLLSLEVDPNYFIRTVFLLSVPIALIYVIRFILNLVVPRSRSELSFSHEKIDSTAF
jgi:hypothetical protein